MEKSRNTEFHIPRMLRGRRRGIHGIISVSMLIGFTLALSAILVGVLAEYGNIAVNNAACSAEAALYVTGDDSAYFVASMHNMGSGEIVSAKILFADVDGAEHGFQSTSLSIGPGESWEQRGSFQARIPEQPHIRAGATTDGGSQMVCEVAVMT